MTAIVEVYIRMIDNRDNLKRAATERGDDMILAWDNGLGAFVPLKGEASAIGLDRTTALSTRPAFVVRNAHGHAATYVTRRAAILAYLPTIEECIRELEDEAYQ